MVAYDGLFHGLHPNHKLTLKREGTPYKCDSCKEPGFHSRYTCEESSTCNFHLHMDCADPPTSLSHPFFKHCSFKFFESGVPRRVCDACGTDAKGSIYHCHERNKDLHPCCANLDPVIVDGDVELVLKREMPSRCYSCGEKKVEGVSTWGYVSTCKAYCLHISCVKKLVLKSWMAQMSFGDGAEGAPEGEAAGALVKRTPMLQLAVGGNRGAASGGKYSKIKKTVQIVITFIIAAILGDPTAIVAGLIANLISH